MDPILIFLLSAALVAFIMAIIWSATKPKKSEPTIEPVENRPLPPIDEQIFDDVIDSPPVIIEEQPPYEKEIVEEEPVEEPQIEDELPSHVQEEIPAEVDENTNFNFEEEEKKNSPPPLEPEPISEPEPDNS